MPGGKPKLMDIFTNDGQINSFESLRDLRCMVTGCSSGMGRSLSIQLAEEGVRFLAICDVKLDDLEETKRICEESATNKLFSCTAHICDVSKEESVKKFRDEVEAAHGDTLDVVINNAGIARAGPFLELPQKDWELCFNVDFHGVVHCTRHFLPMLVRSKKAFLGNISSLNGIWACLGPTSPPHTTYSAAKFAVRGFTEALLVDSYRNFPHVTVSCIHPGFVGTKIVINSVQDEISVETSAEVLAEYRQGAIRLQWDGAPKGGWENATAAQIKKRAGEHFQTAAPLTADMAAIQILDGLKRGETRIMVGEDAVVIDWCARVFPRAIYKKWFQLLILGWGLVASFIDAKTGGHRVGRYWLPVLVAFLGVMVRRRLRIS
jgi:NAD(P)-dependent dehydrogenase (short-subunit alcohol dehydrogenase family)